MAITYGPTATKIYIDGVLSGSPAAALTVYPDTAVRAAGVAIGTDRAGNQRSKSVVDEVETFNYELSADEIRFGFEYPIKLSFETPEDEPATIDLNSYSGSELAFKVLSQPQHGTLQGEARI